MIEGGQFLTADFWSGVIPSDTTKPLRYLEIGTHSGVNLISVEKLYGKHPDSKLFCIDPWEDYPEYSEYKGEMDTIYERFKRHIKTFGIEDKVVVKRGFSNDQIPTLENDSFDIIYIDGNHNPEFVLEDAVLSFRKLKNHGYMIFDDYGFDGKSGTSKGIDAFLKGYGKHLRVLTTKWTTWGLGQVFVQKIKNAMKIHLVMFANGEPWETSKALAIDTIRNCTQKEVIIHDNNLESIKKKEWFSMIKTLPSIDKLGRRDGYYNAYKMFCVLDAYNTIGPNDVLYYLDSSQYHIDGFTENIDKLCNAGFEEGFIAGSVGDDHFNNTRRLCDKINVWRKIIPDCSDSLLSRRHVLNSWFIMCKNDFNTKFLNEWIHWSLYTDDEFPDPLITQHFTVDQSVFNILVVKYGLKVFYYKPHGHCKNKNKNAVCSVFNRTLNTDSLITDV